MAMDERDGRAETAFSLVTEIGIIGQLLTHGFERLMPQGLTMAQFSVLNHLARTEKRPTLVELAQAMQVTKGAMTSTAGHLQRAGLVEVAPHESDGRAKRVTATGKGLAARQAAIAALRPELEAIAEATGAEDMAALVPALTRIRRFLDDRRG
jgi:DNA-binding MarR family transcriptional regulator